MTFFSKTRSDSLGTPVRRVRWRALALVAVAVLGLSLSACGKKGPLDQPPETPEDEDESFLDRIF